MNRIFLTLILAFALGRASPAHADDYEVVDFESPGGQTVRWNIWASEGPLYLKSTLGSASGGNRFRLGGEAYFGGGQRWLVGVAALDIISSGESSADILGGISRSALDVDLGYFLVPDRLWIKYSLVLGDVSGRNVLGPVDTTGHGLSVGYRFYDKEDFNLGVELSYVYFPPEGAGYYDPTISAFSVAEYPGASILSLNFKLGWSMGSY